MATELAVERRLRRTAEEKCRRAEEGRRAAERERDLYRVSSGDCNSDDESSYGGDGNDYPS